MGIFFEISFSVFFAIVCLTNVGLSQNPQLQRVHSFSIEEIKFGELRNITNWEAHGNLLVVSEEKALLQVGKCDIMVIELDSGRVKKKMDIHELLPWVTESLHEHWGEEYCVPGRESFSARVKPEFYPIRLDRIVNYTGKNRYATFTHTVVLNQEKDNERDIFLGVLVFDKELEILEFHALKGHEELKRSPSMNSGGFFHEDTLFIRDNPYYIDLDYDFIKFEKSPGGYYQMVDTMNRWQTMDVIGGTGFFHHAITREGEFHLPMGQKVMILHDWSESGVFRRLPMDSNQFINTMEPIGPDGWSIAWVVNRIYTRHGEPTSVEGYLTLIEPDYQRIHHQVYYELRNQRLLSMSVLGNKVYLLFFDKRKKFIVEVLELIEDE